MECVVLKCLSPFDYHSSYFFLEKREILHEGPVFHCTSTFFAIQDKGDSQDKIDQALPEQTLLMMESTPSRDNRDINIDATLFCSENLAEVRNWKAKVFAFLLFISTAVSALKTTFAKIITRQIHWSIRISLFGLVSTNVHVMSTHVYFLNGEVPCKSDEIS